MKSSLLYVRCSEMSFEILRTIRSVCIVMYRTKKVDFNKANGLSVVSIFCNWAAWQLVKGAGAICQEIRLNATTKQN